ncbi:MAG TPA: bifunctional hydroxymethylpyrimidine kinase/phosphomethylpyrimidine kinase [Acidimicrobiales bacterium]|nr:bifunctional hydroxymethylpyrimidine kinase/phosphomethylpyrimidine kinase [Acidimicrobiales bacterium]
MQPAVAMTIAGSDSGGGAGAQADLRTFAAFGVHGTSALTALTAQNTYEVRAVDLVDPEFVVAQAEAVLDDLAVAAVKTGMLGQRATVTAVAALAARGRLPHLVVDPVLVSSTGHPLMGRGGVDAYRDALIPFARVLTPNLREAAILCGVEVEAVSSVDDMAELGRALLALGARHVVVKGGHFQRGGATERGAPDVVVSERGVSVLDAQRVLTDNDHGTGCSLSAAIAAGLALGRDVDDAIRDAKAFVLAALTGAAPWHLGKGHGPIDHLGWSE